MRLLVFCIFMLQVKVTLFPQIRRYTLMTSLEGEGYLQKMTFGDKGGGGPPKGDIINVQWDYPGSPEQTSGNISSI